ncbi:MAG: helix-turn-helix domain-containing protein [Hyphomicrobium zavarzinii]|uniref:helix-turn-helix domain-containing protein n=1 Tax=Hyphomicrobium zavarzinii TaxID=48292 RepID=UPI001A38FE4E|nr:helix-turn-helix domain-containing protein [Hyphomicrobium zavarzinii]MBL8847591.1 helix-turn-helix domain-containing protein [Hyphomicrobium zavarzinii]
MANIIAQRPDAETAAAARAIAARLPEGPLKLEDVLTPLPPAVANILREVLTQFAAGKAVSVIPQDEEMTPNEAAEFLRVSRGHVAKLMDDGALPYREVGTHRRIPTAALVLYDKAQRARQRAAMEEMVRLDQDMGLYDLHPKDFGLTK